MKPTKKKNDIVDIDELIETTVRNNPGITTKSVLERTLKYSKAITEDTKKNFTKALCNLIEKGSIEVDGFQGHKEEPFEAQLIAVDNNGQTYLKF